MALNLVYIGKQVYIEKDIMAGRKTFDLIVDHLWKDRKKYIPGSSWSYSCDRYRKPLNILGTDCLVFDYPDYSGLSKKISSRLSCEFVDAIQDCLVNSKDFFRKKQWSKDLEERLWELGEKVKGRSRR